METIEGKKILVTGGAGFIGSHVSEYFARKNNEVIVYDNLSRNQLLGKHSDTAVYNWDYLKKIKNITLIKNDIRDYEKMLASVEDVDIIIHSAAQTGVTTSIIKPHEDFSVNVLGTINLLEAARNSKKKPAIIFCSTNKVYGENVNSLKIVKDDKRYRFTKSYKKGIAETFGIDLCEHTPYGCSKLAADLYMQDYAHLYGLKIGVFRMSCIYGTRQFGLEDQGWVAWFIIAALTKKPITIFGDGKQVRDILYVEDLVEAFNKFLESEIPHGVFNMGGGAAHTMSLLELLELVENLTGKKIDVTFANWRASDQKVYISDISKVQEKFSWTPQTNVIEGVKKLIDWVENNKRIF